MLLDTNYHLKQMRCGNVLQFKQKGCRYDNSGASLGKKDGVTMLGSASLREMRCKVPKDCKEAVFVKSATVRQ